MKHAATVVLKRVAIVAGAGDKRKQTCLLGGGGGGKIAQCDTPLNMIRL